MNLLRSSGNALTTQSNGQSTNSNKTSLPKTRTKILDIWLFQDAASYEKNTLLLFKEKPSTRTVTIQARHKALIMNIATGGGTLVHEIVHPFVEANFPACPPWLNERPGLARCRPGKRQL